MKKVNFIVFLLSLFLFSGCRSFYKIDTNELQELSAKDEVQIKFKNGNTLNITNIQYLNITNNNELEIIKYSSTEFKIDSVRIIYPLIDIKEIRVEQFDIPKTIFSTFWITLGSALLLVILFFPDGFSVSGQHNMFFSFAFQITPNHSIEFNNLFQYFNLLK